MAVLAIVEKKNKGSYSDIVKEGFRKAGTAEKKNKIPVPYSDIVKELNKGFQRAGTWRRTASKASAVVFEYGSAKTFAKDVFVEGRIFVCEGQFVPVDASLQLPQESKKYHLRPRSNPNHRIPLSLEQFRRLLIYHYSDTAEQCEGRVQEKTLCRGERAFTHTNSKDPNPYRCRKSTRSMYSLTETQPLHYFCHFHVHQIFNLPLYH